MGKQWKQWLTLFFGGGSKITADGDCSHKIKRCLLLGRKVMTNLAVAAAAAAKSLQSCPTLCDPIDSLPPGCPVLGILQARTLEWVAISFSNACMHAKLLQSCLTLCNLISRLVITFLPRSKHLLTSWLQLPSAVILKPSQKNLSLFPLFPHLFAMK